ncbi:MAG: glutamate--tRNA ligase [Arenicellales bacterium]|nr:glutamate--tRNA ligase [Arenicellales bacterium]
MTVVVRFPPSPTGFLHIGGARTALFNWLYSKKYKGRFVLRIEDTDLERSTEQSVQAIFDGLEWLQLDYDDGPYFQTKRMDRYREVIDQLIERGQAYYCYCSKEELDELRTQQREQGLKPRYDGRCRQRSPVPDVQPVVRFKNPLEGEVIFDDQVKGKIEISNTELDDLIIARSDGVPTYNLTVVVDDMDMGITHVIRGDDHVNNTPKQINILKALGVSPPIYAHVPMILGQDGKRMSKRHGAVSVTEYRDQGYLPHALLNYLVRLGWSHGDQELFTLNEMIELFDIKDVHKSAAVFDPEKLLWVNYEYIKSSTVEDLKQHATRHFSDAGITVDSMDNWKDILGINQDRSKTLVELVQRSRFFYIPPEEYDQKAVKKHFKAPALQTLKSLRDQLAGLDTWEAESVHGAVHKIADQMNLKLGQVAQPLRVAVAGVPVSPPIDATLTILGQEETDRRLHKAIEFIEQNVQ